MESRFLALLMAFLVFNFLNAAHAAEATAKNFIYIEYSISSCPQEAFDWVNSRDEYFKEAKICHGFQAFTVKTTPLPAHNPMAGMPWCDYPTCDNRVFLPHQAFINLKRRGSHKCSIEVVYPLVSSSGAPHAEYLASLMVDTLMRGESVHALLSSARTTPAQFQDEKDCPWDFPKGYSADDPNWRLERFRGLGDWDHNAIYIPSGSRIEFTDTPEDASGIGP